MAESYEVIGNKAIKQTVLSRDLTEEILNSASLSNLRWQTYKNNALFIVMLIIVCAVSGVILFSSNPLDDIKLAVIKESVKGLVIILTKALALVAWVSFFVVGTEALARKEKWITLNLLFVIKGRQEVLIKVGKEVTRYVEGDDILFKDAFVVTQDTKADAKDNFIDYINIVINYEKKGEDKQMTVNLSFSDPRVAEGLKVKGFEVKELK